MSDVLYVDNGGQVACIEHGGRYLKAELKARPNAKRIDTPITAWHRTTAADLGGYGCETCERQV